MEADKAVEAGNQNRSAMASSMLERLKKASADYEVRPLPAACCTAFDGRRSCDWANSVGQQLRWMQSSTRRSMAKVLCSA